MFFKKKTIFDYISDGKLDDAALARRMKKWISSSNTSVAVRSVALYRKQPEEIRLSLSEHGLTEGFVRNHEKRLEKKRL